MRSYKYILWASMAFATVSCKKFLREEPKSIISEDQYYKTASDAVNAVNATYFFYNGGGVFGTGQTAYNSLLQVGMEFATDEQAPGPGATNPDVRSFSVLNHSSTNRTFYENWQQHYAGIKKCNVALEKIPGIDFGNNEGLKKRLLAEAKFNRAFIYFNLVRLWGDVPLITENQKFIKAEDYYVAKSPSTEVYAQIERDLQEAAVDLPPIFNNPDKGRATRGAAKALLAKVYLTKASYPLQSTSHYADAVRLAKEVLSPKHGGTGDYQYDLRTDYSHVFLPQYENNEEHIFSAQYLANFQGQGRNDFPRTLPRGGLVPGVTGSYADQVLFYTKGGDKQFNIYKLYSNIDKRKKVTFATRFKSPTTGLWYGTPLANPFYKDSVTKDTVPYINKAYDPAQLLLSSEAGTNVTLLRYSEILLIHAEAENEANGGPTVEAYNSINFVRERAGLPKLTEGLSQAEFREAVYLERRLELFYEYQRWFDLIRQKDETGAPSFVKNQKAVGKTNAQEKMRLFPIPQIELDNNPKLVQNPGW